ncbi:MAG: phosphomannomutase [Candidatus Aenigmarchaeota archaeon ex4484_224]|nr:MAG: phosphomannomutase [Candidatus Aenigmarchaeota archaeon ex4484_224]
MIKESIFGGYDIRGIYPNEINEKIAEKIAKAYAKFLKPKKVGIGRDIRNGSEEIKNSLIKGLNECGVDVIDFGILPTPLLYYAIIKFKLDGGLMVTASHNPPEYNGIKLLGKNALMIGRGYGLEKIKEIALKENFECKGNGKLEVYQRIIEDYIEDVLRKISLGNRKIKVVVDNCNSVANLVVPKLLEKLNVEFYVLNEKIDPSFPGHLPEPTEENLKELQKKVIELNADLGIAYDGDCDRAVFVDNKGNVLNGSQVLALFCEFYDIANEKIIYDVTSSSFLEKWIKERNGIPIEEKVGTVNIKRRMIKENALLAGEISSHFYFREIGFIDDGIYASSKMIELLSKLKESLNEIVKKLPKTYVKKMNVEVENERKYEIIEKIKKEVERKYRISTLDGVKIYFENGWIVIRPSNTQPLIRIVIDSNKKEEIEKMKKLVNDLIGKYI